LLARLRSLLCSLLLLLLGLRLTLLVSRHLLLQTLDVLWNCEACFLGFGGELRLHLAELFG
jgi:hypothetical protein